MVSDRGIIKKKLLKWFVLEHGKQTAYQSFAKVTETPL